MPDMEFDYKGKHIVIRDKHPDATISVDGREFACHHHHPPGERGLAMWMCEETYFASPDIRELAKHFADYGYMFDDPGRVLVNDEGKVVKKPGGSKPSSGKGHKGDTKPSSGPGGHGGHEHGGGN